jgi:hypothetical protein
MCYIRYRNFLWFHSLDSEKICVSSSCSGVSEAVSFWHHVIVEIWSKRQSIDGFCFPIRLPDTQLTLPTSWLVCSIDKSTWKSPEEGAGNTESGPGPMGWADLCSAASRPDSHLRAILPTLTEKKTKKRLWLLHSKAKKF